MTSPTFTFNIAVALPAPVLVSPASGVLIGDLNQPITLVIQNPPSSPPVGGVTNTFEVATDSAFANIEVRRSVPQAAGGLTSLLLDTLTPSASYFWRVKAEASSAIGAVSGTSSFRIGPAIVPGPYRLTVNISMAIYSPSTRMRHSSTAEGPTHGRSRRDERSQVISAFGIPPRFGWASPSRRPSSDRR
jgi:hypothetical protein